LDEKPYGFENWEEAIDAVMEARERDVMPDQLNEGVWEVFETMAFVLMPKINP
jgi:hypothetical protein